jgi:hypothetical protein
MGPNPPTLYLDPALRIGRGGVREVYRHPDDEGKCVKITHNHSRLRSVRRECRYLRRYARQGKPFSRLTRFYGWQRTNLGPGAVFDLIRDHDGNCSRTLASHLGHQTEPHLSPEEVVAELTAFYHHLLEHRIIVADPALHNLVVHYPQPAEPRLVLVDGVGNSSFIKLADWFRYWAHRDISRKWRRYIEVSPLLQGIFAAAGRTTMGKGEGG